MAYQSLYRRYRPQRFADVVGQEHVIRALRNAVREARVGHAYLFSGPRGTGKTSTARILAKALNCENLADGEPCCVCDPCRAIEAGVSYDLQELDAASNNKVEDVRDLVGKVALGSPGRTKVYILDEVHMLTTAASNALLKTLEEPPEHVKFVLATTDPHRVLPTIRSRTQHFEFRLIPADELAAHVAWVVQDAGLDVDDDAVRHVVRSGGGSARDTLSALDRVAAAGGVTDRAEPLDALLDGIAGTDTGAALTAVAAAVSAGRDPRVLGEQLLARLRDIFLLRMGADVEHLGEADRTRAHERARSMSDRATTRALEAIGEALLEMRQAPDPRIPLEVALVRLTRRPADTSIEALAERVERLERSVVAEPVDQPPSGPPSSSAPPSTPAPPTTSAAAPAPAGPAPVESPAPASPSPETAGTGRPADAARAALGQRRDAKAPSSPARPSGPPAASAPLPRPAVPPAPPPPASGAGAARDAGAEAGGSAPSSTALRSSPVDEPSREHLTLAWADTVLPRLSGLAKAMFSVGRFLEVDGSSVLFALPNEAHRRKCEQRRSEVEQALNEQLGSAVSLRLVVDDGRPGSRPAGPGSDEPPPSDDELSLLDVRALADAPGAPRDGVDRLTEAFPGAQLVEHDDA